LDSLSVDVTAKIGAGVWVRRRSDPVLALEMAGDVRFRKQPAESLTATGRLGIRTGRSYLSFLGRRFDMTRAHVELPGPISDASAEIEARYGSQASQSAAAPDVTALVTVHSTGTSIDLRSVPYMDHASLINYLTTGQTQGEMASGTATGLAVGAALGAVGGAAGRSLGFQVVQVTQDAYGGQTLSAGNYVDPRIYLGFRQPVVQGRSTTGVTQSDTYTTEFEVELEAARRLLFNVQGGGTQYRFLLRPRLGK
jgi:autotransporter translocation and assembly factor TamB